MTESVAGGRVFACSGPFRWPAGAAVCAVTECMRGRAAGARDGGGERRKRREGRERHCGTAARRRAREGSGGGAQADEGR